MHLLRCLYSAFYIFQNHARYYIGQNENPNEINNLKLHLLSATYYLQLFFITSS